MLAEFHCAIGNEFLVGWVGAVLGERRRPALEYPGSLGTDTTPVYRRLVTAMFVPGVAPRQPAVPVSIFWRQASELCADAPVRMLSSTTVFTGSRMS